MLIAITSIPLTAFRMKMAVTVENGMICSVGTQDTLAAAEVLQNGMPVAPEDADNARRAAYEQFAPVFGKKVCEDPSPYGKVVAVEYVIDGKPKPALANWVKWIKQNENYSLALRQPQ